MLPPSYSIFKERGLKAFIFGRILSIRSAPRYLWRNSLKMVKFNFNAKKDALKSVPICGFGMVLASLLVLGAGCTSQEEKAAQPESGSASVDENLELARVEDESITLGQLKAFYAKMPDYLQSKKTGLEKQRRHLQTLIDHKLLQLEAAARGIEQLPVFVRKMYQYRKEKLVGLYQIGKIRVRVSERDIQEYFEKKGLSRRVRFAQIIAANKDSAEAAWQEIDAGQDFSTVAEKWSLHEESAARGGDTGKYLGMIDFPPRHAEAIFALADGQVSEPINLGGRYALYKPLESTEARLSPELYQLIYRQIFIERSVRERSALTDSLKIALNLERSQQSLDTFLAAMRRDASTRDEEVRALVIYRFDGGQITGADLLDAAGHLKYESLDLRSEEDVVKYIEDTLAPDALVVTAAVREGLEQDEEVAGWLAEKRNRELVIQLRVQILEERVSISEEEIRREYDENPDRYTQPEQIEIQEILVDTEAEAQKLFERIQQGESIGELARQYSRRPPELRDEEGRRRFSTADGPVYGRLVSAAWKIPLGQLGGPLHVHEGYSVFKVLSRVRPPASFEESKRRARAIVNWDKKQQVFAGFIGELQTKYADRVTFREDNLKLAFAAEQH